MERLEELKKERDELLKRLIGAERANDKEYMKRKWLRMRILKKEIERIERHG